MRTTGAGIAREDLPYIFDKYYRSRADAGKVGTGLGLSITKAILINHGFPFGVDSEPRQGQHFLVRRSLSPDIFLCKKGTSRTCGRSFYL